MKKYYITFLSFLLLGGCAQSIQKEGQTEHVNVSTNYQNTQYGFLLDYPKDWYINESPNPALEGVYTKLTLISPEQQKRFQETGGYETASANIFISVFKSTAELPHNETKKLNLEEWLQKEGSGQGLFNIEKTTFAGSPAFKALSSSMNEADPEIYVEHKGKIYLIKSEIGDESQKTQNGRIIQTFQWIN